MKLIRYINSLNEIPEIQSLTELTDAQFRVYSTRRAKYILSLQEQKWADKEQKRKERVDKGKKRGKYNGPLSQQQRNYIARANAKGLPFELTQEQFESLCKGICVYCLLPATGVDRRDNRKGYTTRNSQSCCITCNNMKRAMGEDQFIEHCQRIVSVYNHKQYQ